MSKLVLISVLKLAAEEYIEKSDKSWPYQYEALVSGNDFAT